MEKRIYNTITQLKEKYNLNFDTHYYNKEYSYYSLSQEIIREKKFLDELIWRNKKGIAGYSVSPKIFSQHWFLIKDAFDYYLNNFSEKLEEVIMLSSFLNQFFYVDSNWDINNVDILKQLMSDNELLEAVKYITGKDLTYKNLLRESSYYYKDEVWREVKEYFII